jgi:hypothetical protein
MKPRLALIAAITVSILVATAPADLVHQWKFNGFATDSVGSAHGFASAGARLTNDGRLSLDGIDGQVLTSPIGQTLSEKTLVAWVSLDNLDQPGGGSAISVQVGNGQGSSGFDGIVYAERQPGQWMNGSNFFTRSVPDNFGPPEAVENPGEVMMAISYAADDSITIYRNDEIYADPADASQGSLNTYVGGTADVIFGRRHDGAGNPLSGFVNEARMYNTSLDLPAIQQIFRAGPDPTPSPQPPPPALRHLWTFKGDARDQRGVAHGALQGGASILGNRLSVDGVQGSRMLTMPIEEPLQAKTLIAWVSLNDVTNSSRGSALTIQNNANGSIFDAIVYGEAAAQKWMAGSNGFARTQNPQEYGTEETVQEPAEVMVGISYGLDGTISVYRNGEEYGSYAKGSLQPFNSSSVVQIGPRHGNHTDVFDGFINEARIYSGALSSAQMKQVFQEGPSTVPNPPPPPPPAPELVHRWTFDGTADDQVGSANGELFNGASISNGRLALEAIENQYFRSSPIDKNIRAKTLLAWVSLYDLDDPVAGSALTIENAEGIQDTFDGIIYAERIPRQWMAGSDFFNRTPLEDNGGPEETVTDPGEVMMAITYAENGTITIFRNGELYASYDTGTPPMYRGGFADVLIGPRHEDRIDAGGPMHFLAGLVNEARIYDGALSAGQIANIFRLGPGETGDFNGNGQLDAGDIDILSSRVRGGSSKVAYDLNNDGSVNQEDRRIWIDEIRKTYLGDSNLDGEFSSSDFVSVFQAGQYEDTVAGNSTWATGDWNGDGDFTTTDFVAAFQAAGYEKGPRAVAPAVPEPNTAWWLCLLVPPSIRNRHPRIPPGCPVDRSVSS